MKTFKIFAAILLHSTCMTPARADNSIDELRARVERAEKENLRLKAEKLERENLTMRAEALENENSKLRANSVPKSSAIAASSVRAPVVAVASGHKKINPAVRPKADEEFAARRAVDEAIGAISKDDPRRELTAKVLPVSSVDPALSAKPLWTGIYAGINAGYGANDIYSYSTSVGYGPFLAGGTGQSTPIVGGSTNATYFGGPVAGAQVGYNYEFENHIVAGGEIDIDYADINSNHIVGTPSYNYTITPNLVGITTQSARTGLDWIGTARVRVGYSLGKFMPYATGGIAYGQITSNGLNTQVSDYSFTSSSYSYLSGARVLGNSNYSSVNFGWSAGAGAEYLVADHWSVKGEYLYTQLAGLGGQSVSQQASYTSGSLTPTNASGPVFTNSTMGAFGIHQARVGLNYHTDWLTTKPPIIAKF